jgi:hypothetical protein
VASRIVAFDDGVVLRATGGEKDARNGKKE